MKVGDLVKYIDGINVDNEPGLITKIEHWVDKGAPDRNFGTDVWVLWTNGDHQPFDPIQLEIVSESR